MRPPKTVLRRLCWSIAVAVTAVATAMAEEPEAPVAERPMYGNVSKSSDPIRADELLLQRTMDRGYTREQVFDAAIRGGWSAYRAGDLDVAMRRFNQAWLLDPENGQVYWGFAVTVEARDDDLRSASRFFARALTLLPDDADLMVDSARLLGRIGRTDASIDLFRRALDINPDVGAADQGLAYSYVKKGDYDRALYHAERSLERGESLPDLFIRELRKRSQ